MHHAEKQTVRSCKNHSSPSCCCSGSGSPPKVAVQSFLKARFPSLPCFSQTSSSLVVPVVRSREKLLTHKSSNLTVLGCTHLGRVARVDRTGRFHAASIWLIVALARRFLASWLHLFTLNNVWFQCWHEFVSMQHIVLYPWYPHWGLIHTTAAWSTLSEPKCCFLAWLGLLFFWSCAKQTCLKLTGRKKHPVTRDGPTRLKLWLKHRQMMVLTVDRLPFPVLCSLVLIGALLPPQMGRCL